MDHRLKLSDFVLTADFIHRVHLLDLVFEKVAISLTNLSRRRVFDLLHHVHCVHESLLSNLIHKILVLQVTQNVPDVFPLIRRIFDDLKQLLMQV